jgi:hypothetical protein
MRRVSSSCQHLVGINSGERLLSARRIGASQKANKNRRNHTSNISAFLSGVRAGPRQPPDGLVILAETSGRLWKNLRLLTLNERRKCRLKGLDQHSSIWG